MKNVLFALAATTLTMLATSSVVALATSPESKATDAWLATHLDNRIEAQLIAVKTRLHLPPTPIQPN